MNGPNTAYVHDTMAIQAQVNAWQKSLPALNIQQQLPYFQDF
jgi:hypothetical protein